MKYKILITLFAALFILSLSLNIAKADNIFDGIESSQQITDLQTQIQHLQSVFANVFLQKTTLSEAYIAVDVSDNSIIAEKNSNQVYPIASITKLMNAVVAVENIDMDKTIILNKKMLKAEGSSPALFLNLNINAKNLLQASLIQSANDASEALSYFTGRDKFVDLMNQKAKDLNMSNTYFYDTCGISPYNHSTASDLAKLLAYIYNKHPEILSITKEDDFWLPNAKGKLLKFKNVNNMYEDPDFIGAKAGYIPESKQTLASMAMVGGKPIAIVLLHSTNRKTDAMKMVDWIKKNVMPNGNNL